MSLHVIRSSRRHRRRIGQNAVPYSGKILGYGPIAYWIMGEAEGGAAIDQINSPAQDGTYTGVTLGQAGVGDGNTCPLFDGANDYLGLPNLAINKDEGTLVVWHKTASGTPIGSGYVWRYYLDSSNYFYLLIETVDRFLFRRLGNGTTVDVRYAGLAGTTIWMSVAITWSVSGNAQNVYVNGVPETQVAGLAAWNGGNSIVHCVGAFNNTPTGPINGYLAHMALFNSVLTPAQITDLATV